MDKLRNYYLDALVKKGIASVKLAIIKDNVDECLSEIDAIYLDIMKFIDVTDNRVNINISITVTVCLFLSNCNLTVKLTD